MFENIFTLVITFVLCALFLFYKSRNTNEKSPPGPKGYPLVGNVFDVEIKRLHLKLFEWTKEYGDIFQFNLGGRKMVSLNSSDIIREAFALEPNSTIMSARPPTFSGKYLSKYQDMFSASSDEKTIRKRKLVHQVMHVYGDGLKYLITQITSLLSDLTNDIEKLQGKTCNPAALIDRFVMGTLQILLIGKIPDRRDEFQQYLTDIDNCLNTCLNAGVDAIYSLLPFLRFTRLQGAKAYRLYMERRAGLLELLESLTEGGGNDSRGIFQQMMKVVKSGQNTEWFSEEILVEIISFNVVGATFLTTRNTLTSMIRILQSSPDIQKRLQQEVDTVIGQDRKPDANDRYDMPFTEAVILETLRFISHLPLAGFHATSQDTVVRGYHIPKGTTVVPNLWTAHHSDKVWKDPFTFRPDRFFDEHGKLVSADHPLRKQLLVFGIGKRSCVGEVFARTRIFLFLTTLMQKYTVVTEDGSVPPMFDVFDMKPGIVMEAPDFKCRIVRRCNTSDNWK